MIFEKTKTVSLGNSVDVFLMFDYSKNLTSINHYKVNELIVFRKC